jgi:hypothetical protein
LNYKPILQQFAKAYGIKVRCYGEHVGEHIENLTGTHWELKGNIMGTHWRQGKNEKQILLPTPPNFKMKKASHLECMLGPPHWLHEISLPRRVCHYFWPGLIPLAKNTLPIVPIDILNHRHN